MTDLFGIHAKRTLSNAISSSGSVTPPPPPAGMSSKHDTLADMPDAPMPSSEETPESPQLPDDAFEPEEEQTFMSEPAPVEPTINHLPTQEPALEQTAPKAPKIQDQGMFDYTTESGTIEDTDEEPEQKVSPKEPFMVPKSPVRETKPKTVPQPVLEGDDEENLPANMNTNDDPEVLRKAIEQSISAKEAHPANKSLAALQAEQEEVNKKLQPRTKPTITQESVPETLTAPQLNLQHPKEIDPRDRFDDLITGDTENEPEETPEITENTFATEPTSTWSTAQPEPILPQNTQATHNILVQGSAQSEEMSDSAQQAPDEKSDYHLPSFDKTREPVPEPSMQGPRTVDGALFLSVEDYERVLVAARSMTKSLNKGYDDLQAIESSNKTKKAQFTRLHNELDEIQESLMIVDARLFETSTKVIS